MQVALENVTSITLSYLTDTFHDISWSLVVDTEEKSGDPAGAGATSAVIWQPF